MIGVVGGVGPYAGIDLIKKIFDQTKADSDQDHLPVSMLSVPHRIPDRTRFLLGQTDENPALFISQVIRKLHECGASVVGIPCNAVHADPIFDEIVKRIPKEVNLLNMVKEVATTIRERHPSLVDVGVLSTTGTWQARIYPTVLSEYGLNVIQVADPLQENDVNPAIYRRDYGIKARSNPVSTEAKAKLNRGIEHLVARGARVIILGCTEIPLAIDEDCVDDVPLVDPTRILARALIREFAPDRLAEQDLQNG